MLELAAVELNKGKKRCPYKMVFVVNADLGMGIGKACVQIGHASIGMHKTLLGNPQKYRDMLIEWEEYGWAAIWPYCGTRMMMNVDDDYDDDDDDDGGGRCGGGGVGGGDNDDDDDGGAGDGDGGDGGGGGGGGGVIWW